MSLSVSYRLRNAILILLVTLSISLTGASLPAQQAAAAPSATQVILEEPTQLAPAYSSDLCTSGWYRLADNGRGHPAYLTLNTDTVNTSTNSGTWQPTLPQDGVYRVEVYIPSHPSIYWQCIDKTIGRDTSNARYKITHIMGVSTITVDQYPLNNDWTVLGDFNFKAGTSGSVQLTDLTGEYYSTKTVSFSAVRFTWLRSSKPEIYLPAIGRNPGPAVRVRSAWTSTTGGALRQAFTPSDVLLLVSNGDNNTGAVTQANFRWSIQGTCDNTKAFSQDYTSTLQLGAGPWSNLYPAITPNCTGVFTYKVEVNYGSHNTSQSFSFAINNPSTIVISKLPAIDKCDIPSLSGLQTWWAESPYRAFNIYIGGIHRGCRNTGLDPFYLRQAAKMGWTFIPTWVGPQASCSGFRYTINDDPSTAYQQGRSEAQAAADAAAGLGLAADAVIYYDLEGYAPASTACRNTTKAFVSGWTERLHELGKKSGVYGGSTSSYMIDWSQIDPPRNIPDAVWIAEWQTTEQYNAGASVWVKYLPDYLWASHQRIHQYTGDHSETWGGVSIGDIDCNIADGPESRLPQTLSAFDQASAGEAAVTPTLPTLNQARLLSSGQGWALAGDKLLWTQDAGHSWKDITPLAAQSELLLSAAFLSETQGWLLLRNPEAHSLDLLRLSPSGWEALALPWTPADPEVQSASVQFIDAQTGWISIKLQSSSNFSLGMLLKTSDGGTTWQKLPMPIGEPANFTTTERGWVAGGAAGDELYRTEDGGQTWQAVPPGSEGYALNLSGKPSLSVPLSANPATLPQGVIHVEFATPEMGWAETNNGTCSGDKPAPDGTLPTGAEPFRCQARHALWLTTNGGASWDEVTPNP